MVPPLQMRRAPYNRVLLIYASRCGDSWLARHWLRRPVISVPKEPGPLESPDAMAASSRLMKLLPCCPDDEARQRERHVIVIWPFAGVCTGGVLRFWKTLSVINRVVI